MLCEYKLENLIRKAAIYTPTTPRMEHIIIVTYPTQFRIYLYRTGGTQKKTNSIIFFFFYSLHWRPCAFNCSRQFFRQQALSYHAPGRCCTCIKICTYHVRTVAIKVRPGKVATSLPWLAINAKKCI